MRCVVRSFISPFFISIIFHDFEEGTYSITYCPSGLQLRSNKPWLANFFFSPFIPMYSASVLEVIFQSDSFSHGVVSIPIAPDILFELLVNTTEEIPLVGSTVIVFSLIFQI